jgi:hypothetical protein
VVVAGTDQRDVGADGASERWTTQLAGLLLLVAVAAGLLGQGAPSLQRPLGMLIASATLLGLLGRPLTRDDFACRQSFRRSPWPPGRCSTAPWWAWPGAGVGPALLLVGLVAVLVVCRRLGQDDRELLLAGVIGIGLLVALTGWLGVAGRAGSWAFQAQGLWRASSTLTAAVTPGRGGIHARGFGRRRGGRGGRTPAGHVGSRGRGVMVDELMEPAADALP